MNRRLWASNSHGRERQHACSSLLTLIGLSLALAYALWPAAAAASSAPAALPLRVCADPQNLPFSNARGEGFENEIAVLMARALGRPLVYVWHRQDADFVRTTLGAGRCDLLMGLPSPAQAVQTTRPYYWSSYVLISRSERHLDIVSLQDHRLRGLRVGVEAIAGNGLFTPPARRLVEEGLAHNVVPFTGIAAAGAASAGPGAASTEVAARARNARIELIRAVADGRIDMAAVWGPATGYWALQSKVPLRITPIGDNSEFSSRKAHFGLQAMQYQISMAVRTGNDALRAALDRAIVQHKTQIEAVLQDFGIPLIDPSRLGSAAPEQALAPATTTGAVRSVAVTPARSGA
jgi:quinoprotein dehydrogenase-associated probable ABC transporter substrate-binding protein